MKKVMLLFVTITLLVVSVASQDYVPCEGRGGRVVKSSVSGAIVGSLIGGLIGGNRQAMLRGAALGAGGGALAGAVTPTNCYQGREMRHANRTTKPSEQVSDSQREIADASAPVVTPVPGSRIMVRTIQGGADQNLVMSVLGPAAANKNYTLLDQNLAQKEVVDFYIDITVKQLDQSTGYGYGGGYHDSVSGSGYGSRTGGVFQVSVTMISASTGAQDPSRTRTMKIHSRLQGYDNGNVYLAGLYGGGGDTYYTNDPYTAAVEAAINVFFGVRR